MLVGIQAEVTRTPRRQVESKPGARKLLVQKCSKNNNSSSGNNSRLSMGFLLCLSLGIGLARRAFLNLVGIQVEVTRTPMRRKENRPGPGTRALLLLNNNNHNDNNNNNNNNSRSSMVFLRLSLGISLVGCTEVNLVDCQAEVSRTPMRQVKTKPGTLARLASGKQAGHS